MTQHSKIINMCLDGNWHCGNEFRALFIFSPHKRRAELVKTGKYIFRDRPCEHNQKNVRDYQMFEVVGTIQNEMVNYKPSYLKQKEISDSQKSLL